MLAEKQGAQPPEGSEKPGDPKWSHDAVLLLISLKNEFSGMFSSNIITQKQAWKRISEEICNKGYHFSGDVCDQKFRSLKMRYKIMKEIIKLETVANPGSILTRWIKCCTAILLSNR